MVMRGDDRVLIALEPEDLIMLLEMEPAQRLSQIVRFNRTARYANQLNAFVLLERLAAPVRSTEIKPERESAACDAI